MRSYKWVTGFVLFSAAFSLTYCGKPILQPSHSNLTEAQAQADLELRLTKTQEVKTEIRAVRDAIKPIQALLSDLGKAVNLRVEADRGNPVAQFLSRLEQHLKEATKGVIEFQGGGAWVLERPSPLAALPDRAGCKDSRVRVAGQKIENGEEITISASGCSSPEMQTLAVLRVDLKGNKKLVLSATALETIHRETLNLHPCKLKIQDGVTEFTCDPMKIESANTMVSIDRLDYRDGPQGVYASISASLTDKERGLLGTADLNVEPNRPVDVRVCTRGQSCAN